MNYVEQLKLRSYDVGHIFCLGIDPVLERIPLQGETEDIIVRFYSSIVDGCYNEGLVPALVKPNIAFFEQYGFPGLRALKKLIAFLKAKNIPIVLDAKRGDIGRTSAAYARAVFDFWQADAVTVAPYIGYDSVVPFAEWCSRGKGVYILNRTSNAGAVDLQDLVVDGVPLYNKVAELISGSWHIPGVGAVVGATYPAELKELSSLFVSSGKQIPLLIPGVGAQGGSVSNVLDKLRDSGNDLSLHRVNSSSAVSYAYEKGGGDYVESAVAVVRKLVLNLKI
jgi:orotidine-5'-phosphate decarboxylase